MTRKVEMKKIDSEDLEKQGAEHYLRQVSGVLVPGGFGYRGIEGKIKSHQVCPGEPHSFLGYVPGDAMRGDRVRPQCLAASRTPIPRNSAPKTKYPVISLLAEQESVQRLGRDDASGRVSLQDVSIKGAVACYRKSLDRRKRHRHRYEFNNNYRRLMEKKGLVFSGIYPTKNLVEIVELKGHPFFIAVQFHPEFKSKPDWPHPHFPGFHQVRVKESRVIMKAILALEDGSYSRASRSARTGERCGEVVFNTSMTGYQEVITDPSYKGQIVAMTYPLIGNYGINAEDAESGRPFVEGFVVKEYSKIASNWRSPEFFAGLSAR